MSIKPITNHQSPISGNHHVIHVTRASSVTGSIQASSVTGSIQALSVTRILALSITGIQALSVTGIQASSVTGIFKRYLLCRK